MDDTELLVIGAAALAIFSLSKPIGKIVDTVTNPVDAFFGNTQSNSPVSSPAKVVENFKTFGYTAIPDFKSWGDPDKWFS